MKPMTGMGFITPKIRRQAFISSAWIVDIVGSLHRLLQMAMSSYQGEKK
jgi:hypothetical protein